VEQPVVVVGCGAWGRNHARTFAGLGVLRAISDLDPVQAAEVAAASGVPVVSFEDALADPEVKAMVIATPAATHADLARRALEAGKDLLVEKPLALEVPQAIALRDLAAANGRVLMVGHLMRYHPAFEALQQLVADGVLGKLEYLYSNRLNLGRFRQEENILWSFAPHDISMILALVGTRPDGVTATGATYLNPPIADVTTTHLSFPNGVRAHVFVSWLHPFKEQKLVAVGSRAMAVLDDGEPWDRKVQVFEHQIEWREGHPQPIRAEARPVAVEQAEPLVLEARHFLECVETRRTPVTDGDEAVRVLEVLDRAQRSLDDVSSPIPAPSPFGDDVVVHPSSFIDEGVRIGGGTRIWHFSHVLSGSVLGRDCTLGQNVVVGPNVVVGNAVRIQNNVSVYAGVTLEDGVFCGPSCVFTNVLNPRAEVERKSEFKPTPVRRGATIGANATIVCGNEIGEYAMVAAGAVVTHDVVPHALVAGVPARRIGWVSHDGEILGQDWTCPRSGRRYREESGRLIEVMG
jgi:predicted dehydrogenase/serine acetyltransferase